MMTKKTIGLIAVAVVVLFSAGVLIFGHHSQSPVLFNADLWKQQEESNERLRMVDDLKPKLMGISKSEVEQLLGPPRKDLGIQNGEDYFYLLGTERRLLDEDGVWLIIKFKNDKVHEARVWQD